MSVPAAGDASSSNPPLPPPRWSHHDDPAAAKVRVMCSFGGRILPRPGDHQLRYVGGETRIVSVPRSTSFAAMAAAVHSLSPEAAGCSIKYQLPGDDLDALVSLTADEDVDNMMEEIDRLAAAGRPHRLRLFLFPAPPAASAADGAFGSVLSADEWFLDALNSVPAGRAGGLDRGKSEISSVLSEIPDYLFGLDANDEPKPPSPSDKSETTDDNAGAAAPPVAAAPPPSFVAGDSPAWPSHLPPPPPPVYLVPVHHFVNPVHGQGFGGPPIFFAENSYYEIAGGGGVLPVPLYAPPGVFQPAQMAPAAAAEAEAPAAKIAGTS